MARFSTDTTPPPPPKTSRRKFGWILLKLSLVGATGMLLFEVYSKRHPGPQLDFDPSLETVVVLGSGWGATSFLQDLDTLNYNVICVSPRNYFLFTPLLPSCTVGTIESRSIMQPMRYITRFKRRNVRFVEAECTQIDHVGRTITVQDNSEISCEEPVTLKYDKLIVAVGAKNATFGVPGVEEHACFLKEISDAKKIRRRLVDCVETATFPGQSEAETSRLLHCLVIGGGPSGIEMASEIADFLKDDLVHWYPEIAEKVRITCVEATDHVLPMFSRTLIDYAEKNLQENRVHIRNNTSVVKISEKEAIVKNRDGKLESIPFGLVIWATGNAARPLVHDLARSLEKISPQQNQRRGVVVDNWLRAVGAEDSIYCLGDCSASQYTPTAQVAAKQGKYLADHFNRLGYLKRDLAAGEETKNDRLVSAIHETEDIVERLPSFTFASMGMLAYIGNARAVADLPSGGQFGGLLTFYFWRSAYLSNLFSLRNKVLVGSDWVKQKIFGRDIGRE